MKKEVLIFALILILINIALVSANGAHTDEEGTVFPAWTYYVEILEHSLMAIIGIIAIMFLVKSYTVYKYETKEGINLMIIGLIIFIVAQILTNLQHFLILPFGIFTAILHHGLLLVSIAVILIAIFKILEKFK